MNDFQPLNVEQHQNLGYTEKYGVEYGHQVGAVMILPNEFARAQREYPILFRKDPKDGGFFPVVLLGLEENENLFLDDSSNWTTRYIPLAMKKGPFIIGLELQEAESRLVAYVDVNDSRVQPNTAPALFNADGSGTNTLTEMRAVLSALHIGSEQLSLMIESFLKHELLEPVMLEIDLSSGSVINFDAGYTVNIEKLFALKDDAVLELHKSGLLSLAYNIADSLNNIQRLIDIKNARMK